MSAANSSLRDRIHNFFENPATPAAYAVQAIIAILILASAGEFIVEFFDAQLYQRYIDVFQLANHFILAVFTIEYVLKVGTAPRKFWYALRPYSVIDFLAIFPNYLELVLPFFIDTTEIRVLRLVRLLRFARLLRLLKFVRYANILRNSFSYRGTVLQNITPVILLFVSLKGIIWFFESHNLWIADPELGNLFAIIGFALGIILGQKITVSYQKFTQVEESVVRIRSMLDSLEVTLDNLQSDLGTRVCRTWARVFVPALKKSGSATEGLESHNAALFAAAREVEKEPSDLFVLCSNIVQESQFCLSKKTRLTPKPYDTLLQQSTMLYLALVAIFIPGATGMISVLLATYMLYGMYNLTQDFDSIIGGEYDLINLDLSELEQFASSHT